MWGIFTSQAYCPLWGVKPASPWPEVKILDFHTQGRETKPCRLGFSKRTISLRGKNTPQIHNNNYLLSNQDPNWLAKTCFLS